MSANLTIDWLLTKQYRLKKIQLAERKNIIRAAIMQKLHNKHICIAYKMKNLYTFL